MMQEHLSMSSSQPRQCVHSNMKRGTSLVFHFGFDCNLMFRLLSRGDVLCAQAVDR
jgi:hypothetical protein